MHWMLDPQNWVALATLTAVEIVLGIDNIILISILVGRLPARRQERARVIGLALAMITRILLLLSITWVMRLTAPLFAVLGREISGRDLILIAGGLFLLAKSTLELHENLEGPEERTGGRRAAATFAGVLLQIILLDVVFSLDSVVTAVGLANRLEVMIAAIVVAVLVMMASAAAISRFIEQHPTLKVLALSFLLLVGLALVADGIDVHIPKTSIYFAMAFSVFVEMLNMRVRRRRASPVKLHSPRLEEK